MKILHFIFISFFFFSGSFTNAEIQEVFPRKLLSYQTISLDPSKKIQAAIDSVPSNNKNWVIISLSAGVYNEQVTIPIDKPFVYLKGEGIGKTSIVWGAHDAIFGATFSALADNILVSGISFVNSYNYPPDKNQNKVAPAVAARISGDKSAFYQCGFSGYQDTLLDDHGRHFFKLCNIDGAIDFIFGAGQSIYEKCWINVNSVTPDVPGFIAAQAREKADEANGFVFRQCNVNGQGKTYLGRAWKEYSRVIYYKSFLSGIVVPQGWDSWDFPGQVDQLTFSEYECLGAGSDKKDRVKWEKNLSPAELQQFVTNSYIDSDGWIGKLPINVLN